MCTCISLQPRNPCNLGCNLDVQLNGGINYIPRCTEWMRNTLCCILLFSSEGGFSPRDPIGPPLLVPIVTTTGRTGQFMLDLSDAAPQPSGEGSGMGDGPLQPQPEVPPVVVLLFRIEERSSHNTSYIWMVRKSVSHY